MKNTEVALRWIVGILEKHNVTFQIGGGFAAHVYGSPREVADIDIAISEEKFDVILPEVREYLIFGPEHYVDKDWDLQLMTVSYQGQEIDFSGAYQKKFYNHAKQEWIAFPSDFLTSEYREVYGMKIPFMNREKLIGYKKILSRDVDVEDLKALGEQV
jgi:hypothetical protein